MYLDPGTGSFIVQAVIAGVVGVGAVIKLYWARVRTILGKSERSTPNAD